MLFKNKKTELSEKNIVIQKCPIHGCEMSYINMAWSCELCLKEKKEFKMTTTSEVQRWIKWKDKLSLEMFNSPFDWLSDDEKKIIIYHYNNSLKQNLI